MFSSLQDGALKSSQLPLASVRKKPIVASSVWAWLGRGAARTRGEKNKRILETRVAMRIGEATSFGLFGSIASRPGRPA
jgi:hypothetical protein